mmetsp:Transcript_19810/g.28188  ORF Transcript_19810/g.28188 Transcript_19810/m.28188 type:complete len:372 (+) Transcript_19810:121-1236(+)|eukprot:CAMPEP_0172429230 /NCGR_PEP_ID=MMETSP1064-20121228/49490_1 /TAXON_ID=202472 /ORGANISM="Aulacoseira subarctica , Strain CCAP 1002/5" /LENGTH=371 /DNA_ID=CAMNT_0013174487 /DNA_START=90 /DNA_END=1205 /DNA_ORIENTATION=+
MADKAKGGAKVEEGRDCSKVRTHFEYDWRVGEAVIYNMPTKSHGVRIKHEGKIIGWPQALPETDYFALVKVQYAEDGGQLKESTVCIRNVEKKEATAKSMYTSTLRDLAEREDASGSEDDGRGRKRGGSTSGTAGGAPNKKSKSVEYQPNQLALLLAAQPVPLSPIPTATPEVADAAIRHAFSMLLIAMHKGLRCPDPETLQRELKKAQKKIGALRTEAQEQTTEAQEARGRADAMEAELTTERGRVQELVIDNHRLKVQNDTLEQQVAAGATTTKETEEAGNLKRRNEELSAQVVILKNRIKELQELRSEQGLADPEAALAEKNQELEKLQETLTEKDKTISRLKTALNELWPDKPQCNAQGSPRERRGE